MVAFGKLLLVAGLIFASITVEGRAENLDATLDFSGVAPDTKEAEALELLKLDAAESGIRINLQLDDLGTDTLRRFLGDMPDRPDVVRVSNDALRFVAPGNLLDLRNALQKSGALAAFPPAVLRSISVGDQVSEVPVNVSLGGIVYNRDVADRLGIDPTLWRSPDDMLADLEKAQNSRVTPVVIDSDPTEASAAFESLVAAYAPGAYSALYAAHPDVDVLSKSNLPKALDLMRKLAGLSTSGDHADLGSVMNALVTGNALMTIGADWWRNPMKDAGVRYGCVNLPGATAVVTKVEGWSFFLTGDSRRQAAQDWLAQRIADPEMQSRYAAVAGGDPARLDVVRDTLDSAQSMS